MSVLIEDGLLDAGASVVGPVGSVDDALALVERAACDGGLSAAVLDINLGGAMVSPVADRLAALNVPFLFATGYGEDGDRGAYAAARVFSKAVRPRHVGRCRRGADCQEVTACTCDLRWGRGANQRG
ncbi:response regulator [Belnapia sp. F-4-1]|uniref:response regulator n=1 Tax=Belnapia sp. F-4-1 TaxID=1545443 RepID=UPI001F1703C5|nr:response regulator [Belnapia sp. F-4-1]